MFHPASEATKTKIGARLRASQADRSASLVGRLELRVANATDAEDRALWQEMLDNARARQITGEA